MSMKMQIVSCPHCGTFLLQDTAECHGCGHVIDKETALQLKSRALPTDHAVREDMEACPNCGETCRTGLVRCWNCSAFLRPEIEESFRRMQQGGRQVIEHVDLPILEASSVTEEDSFKRRVSTPESYLSSHPYASDDPSGDDDFELSSEAQFGEQDDEGYDLADAPKDSAQMGTEIGLNDLEGFPLQAALIEDPAQPELAVTIPVATEISSAEPTVSAATTPPAKTIEPPVRSSTSEPPVRASAGEEPPSADDRATEDLLKIASAEEQDIKKVRKDMRSKDTFLIYCPQGCRIRVKERHRGKAGKCPRCQCQFVVPKRPVPKKAEGAEAAPAPVLASRYQKWLPEIRLHTVDPLKLRIKADSLLNECQAIDLGFAADEVLIVTLTLGKFGANVKKNPPIRQVMLEHFLKQGTIDTLAAAAKKAYPKELLSQFAGAQPAPAGTESLFADIPVFGVNRIAVRIPKLVDEPHAKYLSFCLSEFRAFVEGMQQVCGVEGFGTNMNVPLEDVYNPHKCHLSQANVLELTRLNYYEKDPGFKLEVSGWKCAGCGIVISEAARAEAKLGGANGKGIAKAKCPKCTQKFGSIMFHQLAGAGAPPPPAAAEAATEPQTAMA